MRGVDGPRAPIRVVVRVRARAEGSQCPIRRDLPMIIVLLEAVHVLNIALKMPIFAHLLFFFFRHLPRVLKHGQILVTDVVPTKITVLSTQIRRLNRRQHIQQILLRSAKCPISIIQSTATSLGGSGFTAVVLWLFPATTRANHPYIPPRKSPPPLSEIPFLIAAIADLPSSSSFSLRKGWRDSRGGLRWLLSRWIGDGGMTIGRKRARLRLLLMLSLLLSSMFPEVGM